VPQRPAKGRVVSVVSGQLHGSSDLRREKDPRGTFYQKLDGPHSQYGVLLKTGMS